MSPSSTALDAVERGQQGIERLIAAQDVVAQAATEVQVGDDERGHAGATMAQARGGARRGSPRGYVEAREGDVAGSAASAKKAWPFPTVVPRENPGHFFFFFFF